LYTQETEIRHSFNVTGCGGVLPDEEVPGFGNAIQELSQDFKQLAMMLLNVRVLCVI
jgi:hypothetical protein